MATGMRALLDTVMQALPQVNTDSPESQTQRGAVAFCFSYESFRNIGFSFLLQPYSNVLRYNHSWWCSGAQEEAKESISESNGWKTHSTCLHRFDY